MRVALVHDYLTQYGGGERLLQALTEIFPRAPIFTLIYDAKATGYAFNNKDIRTSFLQNIPFSRIYFRSLPWLMPLAIEQFNLSNYDLVISNSTSYAKGIITKPKTRHISICPTPPRYLWHDAHQSIGDFSFPKIIKPFIPFFTSYLRIWDLEASSRVDDFIAISQFVQKRIKKYYNRDSVVIYPPVEAEKFKIAEEPGEYFLMVGRLVPYKRFDLAVEAFAKLGLPLKIIGDGPESKKLKAKNYKLKANNIKFLGLVSDYKLPEHYSKCHALIFPQEEDFGIVPLEAMASGRPVIAYKGGGALETMIEGETGIFFEEQSVDSLIEAVRKFETMKFDPEKLREHAQKFDKEVFKNKIRDFIQNIQI